MAEVNVNETTVQIRHVPSELHKQAKLEAVQLGISLNQWLIEAIEKALENKEEK